LRNGTREPRWNRDGNAFAKIGYLYFPTFLILGSVGLSIE
jgi:hypothetical protein